MLEGCRMNVPVLQNMIVLPFVRQADYATRLPWSYGERRLLDYLIVYIEKGHCRFTINRSVYDLNVGDFCLIQPGDLISLEGLTETRTPYAHLDFFYNPQREHSFPTNAGMTVLDAYAHLLQPRINNIPGFHVPHTFRPKHAELFHNKLIRMIGKWKEGTALSSIKVQQIGTELLLELLHTFGASAEEKETHSDILERVQSFVSLHLNETITVGQMADLVHLSPSRFSAVFKERYGMSPYQFLLKLRLERAMEMLIQEPKLNITQISEYCGFNNIQHFSLAFHKTFGISPSQFKKRNAAAPLDPT